MAVSVETVDGTVRVQRGELTTSCGQCGETVTASMDGYVYEQVDGTFVRHLCNGGK